MAEPQKYVITGSDEDEAWERANEFAQEVFMSDEDLSRLLKPMGFASGAEYLFEQQNSDNDNGITIAGMWKKDDMDLDAFLKLVEERESRTLYVGDELVGFKPTIYHRGYFGNNDLRAWFDALAALPKANHGIEFELDTQPVGDDAFAKMFYMITDTIRRHNDAQLHFSYEQHLAQIVEQKQEELDCGKSADDWLSTVFDDTVSWVTSCPLKDNDQIKAYVENRDVIHRILVNKGVDSLADMITSALFNHPEATVERIDGDPGSVEGTPV